MLSLIGDHEDVARSFWERNSPAVFLIVSFGALIIGLLLAARAARHGGFRIALLVPVAVVVLVGALVAIA